LLKPGDILRTFTRGTLKHFDSGSASLVAPGDDVELIVPPLQGQHDLVQQGLHGILTRVLPRRSELRRLHPSGRSIQTICANVDRVYVMGSAAEPEFRPGFVDRVLVCAAACGLPGALIFNKTDLGVKPEDETLLEVYRRLGIEVFKISVADIAAPQGDIVALKERLAGTRSVLTGHSGVGKSSLILALDPDLDSGGVLVGEVSTSTGKGIHTTTHARLFRVDLGGGNHAELIDTPGVREFTPADTDRRNLWGWFPEIARLQGQCSFADCTHTIEKDCAVLAALARGDIHPRRHQSYVRIYQTLPV
jgi:ribosome biogenesis GTPase